MKRLSAFFIAAAVPLLALAFLANTSQESKPDVDFMPGYVLPVVKADAETARQAPIENKFLSIESAGSEWTFIPLETTKHTPFAFGLAVGTRMLPVMGTDAGTQRTVAAIYQFSYVYGEHQTGKTMRYSF